MSDGPIISFVMPTHNRIEWLPLAIDSLRSQTELNIEIVIVDDGSTDGTWDYLEWVSVQDNRIRLVRHETPQGAGPSRNAGAAVALADIVAVCDDDDVYINTRAENILKWFAENPDSELVTFPYVSIDYFDNVVESYVGQPFDHDAFKARGEVSYFCNPATAYKKEAAKAAGGYKREDEGITDDYQFLQNWVGAGKRVDYCGNLGGEIPFATMHRILPNSMMAKIRGFDPAWLRKAQ
jgi:glycosyltransferase involved in cell wall biosynthesis